MLRFSSVLNSVLAPFRDFVYPPNCFVCEKLLEGGSRRVCAECWSSFQRLHDGEPVWHELKNRFSQAGFVSDFLSCYYFEKEGPLQKVIHMLKYDGIKSMGVLLGRDVGHCMSNSPAFLNADWLLPVPLHQLKKRERGYNQALFLCKGISEITGIRPAPPLLHRHKYTVSQTQLNLEERGANVGDAFDINPQHVEQVKGKTIIIVDDVITTGSTISACARVLIEAGAKRVLAASAAVAK